MKVPLPEGEYIRKVEVQSDGLEIDFAPRKKVALIFISLNDRYWPYLSQVIKDCRKNFLPQHKVDYFAWTDYGEESKQRQFAALDALVLEWNKPDRKQDSLNSIVNIFAATLRLYEVFYPKMVQETVESLSARGLIFKREGVKYWVESTHELLSADVMAFVEAIRNMLSVFHDDMQATLKGVNLFEAEGIEWPMPTLMRYHLFLNQEEKLKEYDYIFYLDADMRVVGVVGDEILSEGLLAAEHPMYSLRKEYIPPYEPNPNSTAYIHRPGRVIDENGVRRFKPYYYAGGFQGGRVEPFLAAMRQMKVNIDKDFDNNYTAIWNDESHWNKCLFDYDGPLVVLPPSYVYPDSLIKEYYEPVWGRSYEPKIITLTKPFSLSAQGAEEINKFIKRT